MIRHNGNSYDPAKLAEVIVNRAKRAGVEPIEAVRIWWRGLEGNRALLRAMEGTK